MKNYELIVSTFTNSDNETILFFNRNVSQTYAKPRLQVFPKKITYITPNRVTLSVKKKNLEKLQAKCISKSKMLDTIGELRECSMLFDNIIKVLAEPISTVVKKSNAPFKKYV